MKTYIKTHVEKCRVYQQNKSSSVRIATFAYSKPCLGRYLDELIEGLPKSKGFNNILVVVDRLRKYGHFISPKHPFSTKEVETIFIKEIVRLLGFLDP